MASQVHNPAPEKLSIAREAAGRIMSALAAMIYEAIGYRSSSSISFMYYTVGGVLAH